MSENNKRILYLYKDVENTSIAPICEKLLEIIEEDNKQSKKLKKYKREPVRLYIQTFGGCVEDMWSIIDIILKSKTPIYTYCSGYAMSAGFNIFLAGHKRYIGKHAKLMYHQVSSWSRGTYQYMKERLDVSKFSQKEIENYVLSRTKISKSRLKEVRKKKIDWFITADEAIKLGIADGKW